MLMFFVSTFDNLFLHAGSALTPWFRWHVRSIEGGVALALLGCYDVNGTRHLGHFFALTFRAPYLRLFVLGDGFGALERLAAVSTSILVGRHVYTPDQMVPMKSRLPNSTPQCLRMSYAVVLPEIKDLARQHTKEAIERLVEWMRSKDPKASPFAAKELLNRGWGHAPQYHHHSGELRNHIISDASISSERAHSFSSSARGECAGSVF